MFKLLTVLVLAVSPPLPKRAQVAAPVSLTADEQVLFAEAEEALKRFEAMRFDVPKDADPAAWGQAFTKTMQAMATAMADLQSRYARLSASNRPEIAVPALVRAGEVLEKFTNDFKQLPMPPQLDGESRKAMAQAIEQGAASLLQGARQYYQTAVDRAQVLGFQSEWVDFARARVAALGKEAPR